MVDSLLAEPHHQSQSHARFLAELQKQFLADGGHYERCPMYQAKILADLQDFAAETDSAPGKNPALDRIRNTGRQWLDTLHITETQWADFNDSWQIPYLRQKLYGSQKPVITEGATSLPDSGFVRLLHTPWTVILDCGGVGPEFNPGHCHSDITSLVAAAAGHPVILDPGVLHYSPNDERAYLKSAQAHNGPCLADKDHTEMVGSFRVGRAAAAIPAKIDSHGRVAQTGHHCYPGIEISRTVSIENNRLVIHDRWRSPARSFRPWLRWLWAVPIQNVLAAPLQNLRLTCHWKDASNNRIHVEQQVAGDNQPRLYLGENFASPAFGKTVPAVETIVTGGPTTLFEATTTVTING